MLYSFKLPKFSFMVFCSWFLPFLLWVPSTIGGWLVFIGVVSASYMWLTSFIISIMFAVYLAVEEEKTKEKI